MTKEEIIEIEKDAVETYGAAAQLRMLQEECGELIVAIGHYLRGRDGSKDNLCEELADVSIMVEQIEIVLGNAAIEEYRDNKLQRLKRRLEEHKASDDPQKKRDYGKKENGRTSRR